MKKKYPLFFLGILTILTFLVWQRQYNQQLLRAQEATQRSLVSDNIFTGVKITPIAGSSQAELNETASIKNSAEVKITFTFSFVNKNYQAGDTFETTIPEGITLSDAEGALDKTANYRIDTASRKITITFASSVRAATYNLDLTTTLRFDTKKAAKQTLAFSDTAQTTYTLYLHENSTGSHQVAFYDSEGQKLTDNPTAPKEFRFTSGINSTHADLSANQLIIYNLADSEVTDSSGSEGKIKTSTPLKDLTFSAYETAIDGTIIGEKRTLSSGTDFTIKETTDDKGIKCHVLSFTAPFYDQLEISGTTTFDYSEYKPTKGTATSSNSVTWAINSDIYSGLENTSDLLSSSSSSGTFYVSALGYLNFGEITYVDHNKIVDEPIVYTPIYINGTNTELKPGAEFILTSVDVKELVYIDTEYATETEVELGNTGIPQTIAGTEQSLTNWEITTRSFGEIVIKYVGKATTKTYLLNLYVGRDTSVSDNTNAADFKIYQDQYSAENTPKFITSSKLDSKSGKIDDNTLDISWQITVNALYQKVVKIEDIFKEGVKKEKLSEIKVTAVEFGKPDSAKELVENVDYKWTSGDEGFELVFANGGLDKRKIYIEYKTAFDSDTLIPNRNYAYNTIISEIDFGTDTRITETTSQITIPAYLVTNRPILVPLKDAKTSLSQVTGTGWTPLNKVFLVINPAMRTLKNSNVEFDFSEFDVTLEDLTMYQLETYETGHLYGTISQNRGKALQEGDPSYPEYKLDNDTGKLQIKNDQLEKRLLVSFTMKKTNNFDGISAIAHVKQTADNITEVAFSKTIYYYTQLREEVSITTDETYANAANFELKIPKRVNGGLIKGTTLQVQISPADEGKELTSYRTIVDGEGNELPKDAVTITKETAEDGTSYFELTINQENINGLTLTTKLSNFETSGTKKYSVYAPAYVPKPSYNTSGTKITQFDYYKATYAGSFTIDNIGVGGSGLLTTEDLKVTMIDATSKQAIAGISYELVADDDSIRYSGVSDATGTIVFPDVEVATYRLIEKDVPAGYLANKEYASPGKSITLQTNAENKVEISYVKVGKINVHFTYPDKTPLENVESVVVEGGKGYQVNLDENQEVQAVLAKLNSSTQNYRYIDFDPGDLTGTKEALTVPDGDSGDVYYRFEGLLSLTVPDELTFETGLVLPFSQTLAYRSTTDFIVSVYDSRQITTSATTTSQTRGNLRLNAALTKEFTTRSGAVLKNAKLSYKKGTQEIILNGSGGNLMQREQDTAAPENKLFQITLDVLNDSDGFKLDVPAEGTLADEYIGEITWELIQEP
jgi:uncharacterized surface anchored protein